MIKSSLDCQYQLTSDPAFTKTYLRLALLSSSTDQSRSNTGSVTPPYSTLLVYSESLVSVPILSSIASISSGHFACSGRHAERAILIQRVRPT